MTLNILHVSAECYPIAKVGGLADVVGALPKFQNKIGARAQVIMPFYNNPYTQTHSFECVFKASLELNGLSTAYEIYTEPKETLGFPLYLVQVPSLLFTEHVYTTNDTYRFIAFQRAVLDWVVQLAQKPNIIHCHDHHTGLIPFMLSHCYHYASMAAIPSVLTIHNAEYQGRFPNELRSLLPAYPNKHQGLLEWDGQVNSLAAGIKCAWAVSTVSPAYMKELTSAANSLETLLAHEFKKCQGVINGIDFEVWNPQTDPMLYKNYNNKRLVSGKKANKKAVCEQFGIDSKLPLVVFIGRMALEKGADLIPAAIEQLLLEKKAAFLILGSGDTQMENIFIQLKDKYPLVYNSYIGYNEALAHQLYAAADFLLMPSRVEPCGLNQLYALRYGTLPIVRSIGGLKDTVKDIETKDGFGFCFETPSSEALKNAIERALLFYSSENFGSISKKVMAIDHSWEHSAKTYTSIYQSLLIS